MKYANIVAAVLGVAAAAILTTSYLPDTADADSTDADSTDADSVGRDISMISAATSGALTATSGKYFEALCNEYLDYEAQVIDLNDDGQPEVFTQVYGICLGGQTGVSLNLYVRDENENWNPQFGFPGIYSILESRSMGYPDIEIGGPGSCFPVWRWDGQAYQIHTTCSP